MSNYTFKQFQSQYPDDGACLDKIMAEQHGGLAFSCPGCGADSKFSRIAKRRAYACQHCGHHVYPCVGTIFEKSRTLLTNWFFAMYLMTSTRHGVAAKELQRQIGCTYKTAWRMAHELRKLMASADNNRPLKGHVEIDETYMGGRSTGKGPDLASKTMVFGMVERDGIVRTGPVMEPNKNVLRSIIVQNVEPGTTISTDKFQAYKTLRYVGPYQHDSVDHGKKEWTRGKVHTQTIEGFWAHLKRSIRGTHVHVSPKHLWKYCSEFSFRYNMRNEPEMMFHKLISSVSLPRLQET